MIPRSDRPRIPDFFIVGAPRCGTTFMHAYLRLHPEIYMPERKEPHFFAPDLEIGERIRDRDEYLDLFAAAGDAESAGEASVWYLYSRVAARQIREFAPAARIIVMLRDPIELMRSLHTHNVRYRGEGTTDFERAVAAEPGRVDARAMHHSLRYAEVARLGEQVARLLSVFPREAVHFVLLEDVAVDPRTAYAGVLRFLGVDEVVPAEFHVINETRRPRSRIIRRAILGRRRSLRAVAKRFLSSRAGAALRTSPVWRVTNRLVSQPVERPGLALSTRDRLRAQLAGDVALLSELVGTDLAARWWGDSAGSGPSPAGGGAAEVRQ